MYKNRDGSLAIRFMGYQPSISQIEDIENDCNLMNLEEIENSPKTLQATLRQLHDKHLTLIIKQWPREKKIQHAFKKVIELNLLNTSDWEDNLKLIFDNLNEYVYLSGKATTYLTDKDLDELEKFNKLHKKLEEDWILYFDDQRNIIAQK